MPAPKDTLATGEGVSEGYCTCTLWSVRNQGAETMPEGAIVVARHGEPWMLEPEHLGRAAGFVFAEGGTNNHVAISLRQAGKPCLLVGEQYQALIPTMANRRHWPALVLTGHRKRSLSKVTSVEYSQRVAAIHQQSVAVFSSRVHPPPDS